MLLWCACLLAASACDKPALEETQTTAAVPVTVEAARADTLRAVISVSGTVTPAPGADWVITAPEAARIAELPKAEGDAVAEGDVLVRFDIPTLASEVSARRAAIAQAAARVDLAKAAVVRLSGLVTKGVAARREVEEAQREQLDAEATLTQAQSALEAATALADRAVVRARFAGVVAKRWHNAGDFVEATVADPVLRVINPSRLQVLAAVPVADLPRVQPGHTARVIGPSGGDGDAAVVAARSAQVDPASATGDVRLSFARPTTLTTGTTVQVVIVAEERKAAVVVPAAAIVHDGDDMFVMVAGSDGKAHKHAVTLGLVTRDSVEVLSGVAVGDVVITHGQDGLPDGAAITVGK
jgi:cobalt-zinc-cadmium efflux system membrane fusion protein